MSSLLLFTGAQNLEPNVWKALKCVYSRARFKLNFNSKHRLKDSGVPQGSSLDPLSFRLDLVCFGSAHADIFVFFMFFFMFHNFISLYPCQLFGPFPAS